jgi:hypothetical protein
MPEDYIMRLIQQIGALLAAILAKRGDGRPVEARQELDSTCLQTLGLPLATLKRYTPEALAKQLEQSGGNRYVRSIMLAELLIQDAELLAENGEPRDALASYLHSFCLIFDSYPFLTTDEQAIYRPKLEMLAAKLEHLPPNPYVTHKLRAFREGARACG